MPDTDAQTDAQRLCAAIDAVFGDDSCAKLVQFLTDLLAAQVANPDVYMAPDTAGPCTEVTVFFDTNRPDLHYDVMLYKLPDITTPIFSYDNIAGAPIFGTAFPVTDGAGNCLFQAGNTYRVCIRVHPPAVGLTNCVDIICASGIPLTRPNGEDGGMAMAAAGNGSRTKRAAVAVGAAITKPASKSPGKSKK